MDTLARAEKPRRPVDCHYLRRQRLEVHFDPPGFRVIEAAVRIGVDREIAAQDAVHVVQHIAVERRGHPERIVVGRVEARLVLDRVDTDQESAAGYHAVPADRLQECERIGWREIADRRARIEKGRGQFDNVATQVETEREIRDDPQHLHLGKRRGKAREGPFNRRGGNVHGDVASRFDEGKPGLGLPAITGAEIDELTAGADRPRNVRAMGLENRPLGAGRVILG